MSATDENLTAVRGIALDKSFGATHALRSCSLELRRGEVHSLVGENGSGKSTLVKILSGVHHQDAGALEVGGIELRRLRSPRDALRAGIATVFQEVLVVELRSVLENVWLGSEGVFRSRLSPQARRALANEVLVSLLGKRAPLDAPAAALSLGERQAVVIARALVHDSEVLILDEATSALDVATRDRLFEVISHRAEQGAAVLFISHRMDEIEEVSDRITVMRSGTAVGTFPRGAVSANEIVRLMVGSAELVEHRPAAAPAAGRGGEVVLSTEQLVLARDHAPIDVQLRAGELVGLAGLEGHGQEDFLYALWGGRRAAGRVLSGAVTIDSPQTAAANRIALLPRERQRESLFESKSILENFALPTLRRDARLGFLRSRSTNKRFDRYVQQLHIRLGDPADQVTTLSGGTQQKVVIARWLALEPRVLLLNDPTRGIDIATKREFYDLLLALSAEGICIVMLSTEVEELVELMHRVLVFRDRALARELDGEQLSRQAIVAAFFGVTESVGA